MLYLREAVLSFQVSPCYKFLMSDKLNAKALLIVILLCLLSASCFGKNTAEEYFRMHGMTYPVDVSGVSMFAVEYVGIDENELMALGAKEFVEQGIVFIKRYLKEKGLEKFTPNISAMTVDKPVLFRDESGEVGLMVRINAFGSGKPADSLQLPVKPIMEKQKLWKVRNFAYFNRNDLYNWQYGGLVFSR